MKQKCDKIVMKIEKCAQLHFSDEDYILKISVP